MRTVLPIALFALAGVLVGGIVSMYRQGGARPTMVLMGVLAVAAAGGGVLWMLPEL